jgi:hypothetical protein
VRHSPRAFLGYDPNQVRLRLSLIAFAVDAGFAPPAVTPERFAKTVGGCDKQAVDRFVDTLASDGAGAYGQPVACGWPFAGEGPLAWDRFNRPRRRARRRNDLNQQPIPWTLPSCRPFNR